MAEMIFRDPLRSIYAGKAEEWRGNKPLPSMESLMWDAAIDFLDNAPSVEAVPLDLLCEWLAQYAAPPRYVRDPDATEPKARWMSAIREVMEYGLLDMDGGGESAERRLYIVSMKERDDDDMNIWSAPFTSRENAEAFVKKVVNRLEKYGMDGTWQID